MPLFWKYIFMSPDGLKETCFYADSEVQARKYYSCLFEVDAKTLVRRENW